MYRKLVFVLTMFAVAFGSLSQAQAALASAHPAARVASAAHAGTPASIATLRATGAVRPATATRPMAYRARLRTEQKQGSLPLGAERRATERASAPKTTSAPSLAAPAFTSAASTTFTVGQAGTFTVSTTGTPPMSLSATPGVPPLPSGVTFRDNRNGTATLSGTPAAGTTGTYTFTITALNLIAPFTATQSFTLTVNQACQITSDAGTTFNVGQAGTFTVTTTGVPNCALSESGVLPTWLTWNPGTATLSGTPPTGSGGTYPFTITATNSATPAATQTFTLTVHPITCTITSSTSTSFTTGQAGTFTVTTSGVPPCVLSKKGALPTGVTFTDNGDGTATLAGTPAPGTGGTYPFTITATNVAGHATQSFTLTVDQACQITSVPPAATLTVGFAWSYTVTSTGWPTCALSATGQPSGVMFTDNGDGTGTFSGTPTTPGTPSVTITAHNGVGSNATQTFTLTVNAAVACAITSVGHATFTVGQAGTTFNVTTTGTPTCTLSATGLPSGVTFTDNGDGTATISGTPAADSGGLYTVTITAMNGVSPPATQTFTLSVLQACQITSSATDTFTVGQAGTYTVTTTGTPTCTLSETGTLPTGVTFTPNADGTATITGTPAAASGGPYPFTITATNGVDPAATQTFTLTVNQPCQITSADQATFAVGQAGTFTGTSTGWPVCAWSESRNLPPGLTAKDNGDGTATLSGTPTTGGVYTFRVTARNVAGSDSQLFTLIVLQRPQITSADHTTCTVGKPCAFTVTSTGVPTPNLSEMGELPWKVTFTDNGDGTATLSGTPRADTGGTYKFSIIATNGAILDATPAIPDALPIIPEATQHFTLTVVGLPAAPSGLKATGKGKTVSLTWTNHASAPSAATAILIQRSTDAGFTTGIINTTVGPTVTTHTDTTVVKGKKYYYRVRASNAVGNSAWSNMSNVTAP